MITMGMQVITILPDVTIIYHAFESQQKDFLEVLKEIKGQKQ
jgi:hypothetical protein